MCRPALWRASSRVAAPVVRHKPQPPGSWAHLFARPKPGHRSHQMADVGLASNGCLLIEQLLFGISHAPTGLSITHFESLKSWVSSQSSLTSKCNTNCLLGQGLKGLQTSGHAMGHSCLFRPVDVSSEDWVEGFCACFRPLIDQVFYFVASI